MVSYLEETENSGTDEKNQCEICEQGVGYDVRGIIGGQGKR